jgi:hypothetical protein
VVERFSKALIVCYVKKLVYQSTLQKIHSAPLQKELEKHFRNFLSSSA